MTIINKHNVDDPKNHDELRALGFVRLKPGQVVAEKHYTRQSLNGQEITTVYLDEAGQFELVEVKP